MSHDLILFVEGRQAGDTSMAGDVRKAGYDVCLVHTGRAALEAAERRLPELIVFDTTVLEKQEHGGCKRLRQRLTETPIIHIRGAGIPRDDESGATVFLVHPFTSRKLLNRVRVLIPSARNEDNVLRAGDLLLYQGLRIVVVEDQGESRLTPRLARLLEEFMAHPGIVLSRPQLMRNVWQTDYLDDTRTLDVHVRWLREAIEEDPSRPERLLTVRGEGYILHLHEA